MPPPESRFARSPPMRLLFALSAFALLTAAVPPPTFDAIRFFSGRTEGKGRFKIILRAGHDLHVQGVGRMDGDTLILSQIVTRDGTPPKPRQWRIREVSPGRYTGTLTDAKGAITGETTGNRLHLAFTSADGFAVEQWLVLSPDGRSAQNRLTASKFGITVATVDETIRKLD